MHSDTKDTSITVTSSSEKIYYTLFFLCLLQDQQRVMGLWSAHALDLCTCVLLIFAHYYVGVCIVSLSMSSVSVFLW